MKTILVSFLLALSSSAPTPVSLGHALQPARVTAGDGFFVYIVDEAGDGGQDWNGDGDSKDKVAHVYDLEAGCEKNLRVPVHSQFPDPAGDLFLFGVRETSQGHTDLNGDGDTSDIVVHVYEHGRGTVTNLGLAVDSTEDLDVAPGVAYFEVNESDSTSESGQGADLNGDGDTDDRVGFFYAPRSGGLTNTMLDARKHVLAPSRGAFMVHEGKQGGTDLDGDGEAASVVLHMFHAGDGSVTNTGALAFPLGFTETALIAAAFEWHYGLDFNGDRDQFDGVLYPLDLDGVAGQAAELVLHAPGSSLVGDRWAAVNASEWQQALTDLNGDGDVEDTVLHLYDSATGELLNFGFATLWPSVFLGLEDGLATFFVDEDANGGTDLNGNGSVLDDVLHVHDTKTGATINLGFGTDGQVDGRYLAYIVGEADLGTDLNRDGDEEDATPHVFDRRTESVRNLGWAVSGGRHRLGEAHLVALVEESGQGAGDLNDNGSVFDDVYHLYRLPDGARLNLGLAGDSSISASNMAAFTRGHVMLLVSEANQGEDLNGDGDTLDRVPFVVSL